MIGIPERLADTSAQWRALSEQLRFNLRVACPGIIQDFDAEKQTVTVKLALRENVETLQGHNGTAPIFIRRDVEVVPLLNVPVVFPRGGNFLVTMPLQAGDECLIIFGDMCIDAWWESGGVQNQIERR